MTTRHIVPELLKYLDDALGAPLLAALANNPVELMTRAASVCVGVMEQGKDNCGPVVEMFQNTAGKAAGQPWCLDFVQSMIAYAEIRTGVKSACQDLEQVTAFYRAATHTLTEPERGLIVCWEFGTGPLGHCGIVTAVHDHVIETIEGNTSPSGIVEREGDGVYAKIRAQSGTSAMRLVGYVQAF